MVTAHREMQINVVACETHFRPHAHKDGLGSALNKCVCLFVCPQWDRFLLFWWKTTPFFIAPQAICYSLLFSALYDPRSHGKMLSQTLLVSHSVSFSACQLVKNWYRSGEKPVNPVQPSLQRTLRHSLQAMLPVELVFPWALHIWDKPFLYSLCAASGI